MRPLRIRGRRVGKRSVLVLALLVTAASLVLLFPRGDTGVLPIGGGAAPEQDTSGGGAADAVHRVRIIHIPPTGLVLEAMPMAYKQVPSHAAHWDLFLDDTQTWNATWMEYERADHASALMWYRDEFNDPAGVDFYGTLPSGMGFSVEFEVPP